MSAKQVRMESVMGPIKLAETNQMATGGDLFMDGESAALFASGEVQSAATTGLPERAEPISDSLRGKAIVTPRGELMSFELLCA